MLGVAITHWTIRLALIGFASALAVTICSGGGSGFRWYRLLWTAGCGLFMLHVISAFQFFYQWSHSIAVAETAAQTEVLIGTPFGRGIWFSYLFALVWTADVAWAWGAEESYRRRSAAYSAVIVGYLCFIAFQGAVVFEAGVVRPLALLASVGLLLLLWWTRVPHFRARRFRDNA